MSILLTNALRLPVADVEALTQGRTIAAIAWNFINPGQTFALYPDSALVEDLPVEQCYRTSFLSTAKNALKQLDKLPTNFWARCEECIILEDTELLESVSRLTIWTKENLEKKLNQGKYVFIAYLRVFKTDREVKVLTGSKGQFVPLQEPIEVLSSVPIITDENFVQCKHQLINLEAPAHPELEELQATISQLAITDGRFTKLEEDLQAFLGWTNTPSTRKSDPDLNWIKKIAEVGNSSDGDSFEKLVRRSFVKLGFKNSNSNPQASLDPEGCGGAGGLDFYCEKPYKVVGECKATKTELVPDSTPAQLIKLGHKHLQEGYDECIKIIMAAGTLNSHAKQTAVGNKMNVIRPETLQKLAELKAKHEGSVDLLTLEPCLREAPFGEDADEKLNRYIDRALQELKLRSQLIEIVKRLTTPEKKQHEVTLICNAFNVNFFGLDNQSAWLDNQTVYELLIELSSPLAGHLGRLRVSGLSSDRFYFLRDLPVDDITN